MINPYFLFLIAIIPTIIVHELAHFIACKKTKCGTDYVNIGFGKPIFSFYYKNTRYNLTPILLGGYVKLEGELELSDSPTAFVNLAYSKKAIIALAGCAINILLGIVLVFLGKVCSNFLLYYIGFFNLCAGFGNLLPLPGLDGSYPIMVLLEKIMKKEKAILLLNKIVKWAVRVFISLNVIILPWFIFKGIYLLKEIIEWYYKG